MSENPGQYVIDTTYGALVGGIWIQQFFCGIVFCQLREYYRNDSKDTTFIKSLVALMAGGNTFLFVTDFLVLYRCSVTHYGDYSFFNLQSWTMWAEPGVTALIALCAQLFFLFRCHRIMDQWRWSKALRMPVLAILLTLILLSTGSGLSVMGSFWKVEYFSELALIPIPISFWLISTTVADLSLTAVLMVALFRNRSQFKSTNTVLQNIILLSVETSAATSCFALLNLIFYFTMMNTAYHLLPQFSISRIYTINVLATIASRRELKAMLTDSNRLYMSTLSTGPGRNQPTQEINIQVSTIVEGDGLGRMDTKKDRWGASPRYSPEEQV